MAKTSPKHQNLSDDAQQAIEQNVAECACNELERHFPNTYTVLSVHLCRIQNQWHLDIGLDKTENGYKQTVSPSDIPHLEKVTLQDCEAVTRAIEDAIDALPELKELPYRLNISSPGIFRALTSPTEFNFYQHWPIAYQADKQSTRQENMTLRAFNPETSTATIQCLKTEALTDVDITTLQWNDNAFPKLELNPPLHMPDDASDSDDSA